MLLYPGLTPLDLIAPYTVAQRLLCGDHWLTRDVLARFGVVNLNEWIVIDRNRISGGGVTAGLDFGLILLAELFGELFGEWPAQLARVGLEYDPQPPFNASTLEKAGPELSAQARSVLGHINRQYSAIAEDFAERGWGRARAAAPAGTGG